MIGRSRLRFEAELMRLFSDANCANLQNDRSVVADRLIRFDKIDHHDCFLSSLRLVCNTHYPHKPLMLMVELDQPIE